MIFAIFDENKNFQLIFELKYMTQVGFTPTSMWIVDNRIRYNIFDRMSETINDHHFFLVYQGRNDRNRRHTLCLLLSY